MAMLRQAYAAPVNGGRTSPVVILMVKVVGTTGFRAKSLGTFELAG